MTKEQYLKNLSIPDGKADVVLDTDTFNEIDDQFALSYLIRSDEKLTTKAIYAAPFLNDKSESPADGMEKSYNEITKLLGLLGEDRKVYKGSTNYLPDEKTPVISPAALDLTQRAMNYTPEAPLYVVAIGAITNIASALLIKPEIAERIVIVWLGGHAHHFHDTREFNMMQDIAAARVVFKSEAPVVQLPCMGVVSAFTTSGPELREWLSGKNPLADYLAENTVKEAESYAAGRPWTRAIWDVTAVGWLLNENDRFMYSDIVLARIPGYDNMYEEAPSQKLIRYVYYICRDELFGDLVKKITG